MKTTLDIPDDLYRQAKIKAAKEGRKIKELVSEGLAWVVREESSGTGVREAGAVCAASKLSGRKERVRKQPVPAWYGVLSGYADRRRGGNDMESIRDSIARGLSKERHL